MSKLLHLRTLSQRERQAVMLVRKGGDLATKDGAGDAAMAAAFAEFARVARTAAYVVLPPEAPYVHADEQKLLACLTLLQRHGARQWTACDITLDCELTQAARVCAALLDDAGQHLCHRNAIRVLESAGSNAAGVQLPRCDALLPSASGPSGRTGLDQSLEGRILKLVADEGAVAAHDLHALGATTRMVRNMRRKGMLQRIRHGIYALGQIERRVMHRPAEQNAPA